MQGKLACVIWKRVFDSRGHKPCEYIEPVCVYCELQHQSSGPWNKQLIESHITYPSDHQLKKKAEAEIPLLIKTTYDNLFGSKE